MMKGLSRAFLIGSTLSTFLAAWYFVRYLTFPAVSSWSANTNFATAAQAGSLVQYQSQWIDFRELRYYQNLIPSGLFFLEVAGLLSLIGVAVYPFGGKNLISRICLSVPPRIPGTLLVAAIGISGSVMVFSWLLDFLPGMGFWNQACLAFMAPTQCAGSEIVGDTAFLSFATLLVSCSLLSKGKPFWKALLSSIGLIGAPILIVFEGLIYLYLPEYFFVNATDFLSKVFAFEIDPLTLSTYTTNILYSTGYKITNLEVGIAASMITIASLGKRRFFK